MGSIISPKMPPQVITDALAAFTQLELQKFDPLVGENACQIRAAKLCELAQRIENPLSEEDHAFVVYSYFLTLIKQQIPHGYTCIERIEDKYGATLLGISSSQVSLLRKGAQKFLSQQSVRYVQNKANGKLSPFVKDEFLKIDAGREMIPCFFTMKVLLKKQRVIILKAIEYKETERLGEEILIYQQNQMGKASSFQIIEKGILPDTLPAMVIEGYSLKEPADERSLREKISAVSLKLLVFLNAAAHHQYAGEHKSTPIPFPEGDPQKKKMGELAQLAPQLGCCLENPITFCIDHIYPAKIGDFS